MRRKSAAQVLEEQLAASNARFDRLADKLVAALESLTLPREPAVPASPPPPALDPAIVRAIDSLNLDERSSAYRDVVQWAADAVGHMEAAEVVHRITKGWAHELEEVDA